MRKEEGYGETGAERDEADERASEVTLLWKLDSNGKRQIRTKRWAREGRLPSVWRCLMVQRRPL